MTYALAWPLQQAVYDAICADETCATFFGHRVFDGAPPLHSEAAPEGLYLTLGDERAEDFSTATSRGARHYVTLSIHAPRRSFAEAKQAAGAVSDALLAGIAPSRGHVVHVRFIDARTDRDEGDALRRIDLRFAITAEDE